MFSEVIQQSYWIGAADFKETEWTWVIDLSKLGYSNWNSGQPNNAGGNEDCAHFYKPFNYEWNDMPCNYTGGGYICESENVSGLISRKKIVAVILILSMRFYEITPLILWIHNTC